MLCCSHRLYFLGFGRNFAIKYLLQLQTFSFASPSSFPECLSRSFLAGAALCPAAVFSLLSLEGCVSHCSFSPFPLPFCLGGLMCPKLSSSPLFQLAFQGAFKACQETSSTQVGRGDEADWSTKACCRVISRLPKRQWPFFSSLPGQERTSNPLQLKSIDVSAFSYCV